MKTQRFLFLAIVIWGACGTRLFAQEPAVGDRVVVAATSTQVMAGAESKGSVPRGTEFAVEQVNAGGWLRGTFTIGGQKVSGWVKTTDTTRAKTRPAPRAETSERPNDMALYQAGQAMFQKMIHRYSRQYEFPATVYGFLPIRQGLPDSVPANINPNSLEVLTSDLLFAREPFDPSTAREPETTQLLQALPAVELDVVLEKVRQLAEGQQGAADGEDDPKLLDLAEVNRDLPSLLEKLAKRLPTDAYAIAQQAHQQLASERGPDDPQTMNSLAWVFYIRRLHAGLDVETTHHRLLASARKAYGENHPLTARAWNNLALVRHDRGDFEAARRLLVHVLSVRSANKSLAADVPLLLINLSRVLETEGRLTESIRCGEVARMATRSLPKRTRELVAESFLSEFADPRLPETGGGPFYMRSGVVYRPAIINYIGYGGARGRQDGNETERSDYDALNMTQIFGGSRGGYPHTPYMLAAAHFMRQGDHGAAERFDRKAIELAHQTFDARPDMHWHISMNYQSLGMTLATIGNHEAAIEVLQAGMKIQRPLWEKEWKDAQAAFGGGQGQFFAFSQYGIYAQMMLLNAKAHADLDRLEEAEKLYREALVVAKLPTSIDKRPMTAKTSHAPQCEAELASVLLRLGKKPEAEKMFREMLALDYLHWCFGFWKETRTYTNLGGLASILADKGTPEDAVKAVQMFHDAYLLVTGGGAVGPQKTLIDYVRTLQKAGRNAEALQVLNRAIAHIERSRRQVGGDEINRARYFSELTKLDPYSMQAQLLVELGTDFKDHFGVGEFGPVAAFNTLEQGRGRALLDLMSRGGEDVATAAVTHARNLNDQALLQRVEKLRADELAARKQVAAILDQGAASINTGGLAQLQAQLTEARKAEIQAKRDLFDIAREALEKNTINPLTAETAAKVLRPNEAILVYDVGDERSLLLVVWPDGKVDGEFLKTPDGKPIGNQQLSLAIADFFKEISREESADTTTETTQFQLGDLCKILLPDSLVERLKKCDRLFVVGDGPLHRLPFETLFLDDGGEQVLLDQVPAITYGPSATILLYARSQKSDAPTRTRLELLALGDPQFTKGDVTAKTSAAGGDTAAVAVRTRSLSRFGTLVPLPGTRAEIDIIRQTLLSRNKANEERLRVLSGADATLTKLVQSVDQPRFLHLATHGLAEGGRKAYDSALALAAPDKVTADDTGFLRLSDLLAQWGGKLHGTELVVLSACRTARGEMESGDGFVALTWGFLFAGSKAVVASLWEVDDTATALLMSRLYENLLGAFEEPRKIGEQSFDPGKSLPQSLALREAKLWVRGLDKEAATQRVKELLGEQGRVPSGDRPFADPYYWGAFVLIGNSD